MGERDELREAALYDLAFAHGIQAGMRATYGPETEAQLRRQIDRLTTDALRALKSPNPRGENV
jgi:hypothetical protein